MARWLAHPETLPTDYYVGIGRVIAGWTRAEVYLQAIIWHHMGLDFKQGRALTHIISCEKKLKLLAGQVQKWGKKRASAIMEIHDDAKALNDWRNKLVHGVWGHEPTKPDRLELMYINNVKNAILPDAQRLTAVEVVKIADDIDALTAKMKRYLQHEGAQIP